MNSVPFQNILFVLVNQRVYFRAEPEICWGKTNKYNKRPDAYLSVVTNKCTAVIDS